MLQEVSSVLRMLDEAYKVFGLTYKMALSTRPEGYLGTLEQWDKAEAALTEALDSTGQPWEVRALRLLLLLPCAAACPLCSRADSGADQHIASLEPSRTLWWSARRRVKLAASHGGCVDGHLQDSLSAFIPPARGCWCMHV